MGYQMRRIMEAAGQKLPDVKPILELNPNHALVARLENAEGDLFGQLAHILLDQAIIAEGGHLDDPAAYVKRLNSVLTA
jgi:molecular chaperone HtpG